jgi:hypothetical protein
MNRPPLAAKVVPFLTATSARRIRHGPKVVSPALPWPYGIYFNRKMN